MHSADMNESDIVLIYGLGARDKSKNLRQNS